MGSTPAPLVVAVKRTSPTAVIELLPTIVPAAGSVPTIETLALGSAPARCTVVPARSRVVARFAAYWITMLVATENCASATSRGSPSDVGGVISKRTLPALAGAASEKSPALSVNPIADGTPSMVSCTRVFASAAPCGPSTEPVTATPGSSASVVTPGVHATSCGVIAGSVGTTSTLCDSLRTPAV